MAVSVPKRLFKRAVDRNLLKRRIREAYRRQKPGFYEALNDAGVQTRIVVQFKGRNMESYQVIDEKLKETLAKLMLKLK